MRAHPKAEILQLQDTKMQRHLIKVLTVSETTPVCVYLFIYSGIRAMEHAMGVGHK